MSRFFRATGDSDSESSSESSDDEQNETKQKPTFMRAMVSDDEEDEKRVVRSQKDKRYDELKDLIHVMRNSQKIKDITKVQSGFESLQKVFQKSKTVIEKEGGAPRFYLRSLIELEEFIKDLWEDKEAKAKLSKINARALATLKQKVRKYVRDFEAEIASYQENPIQSDEEVAQGRESASDEDDGLGAVEKPVVKPVVKAVVPKPQVEEVSGEESDDDSIQWDMSEDSSSSESDLGGKVGLLGYSREYFLKKTKDSDKPETKVKRQRKVKLVGEGDGGEEEEEEEGWETVQRRAPAQLSLEEIKRMLFGKEVEIDHDVILKKRAEIVAVRGKKTADRKENMDHLKILLQLSDESNLGVGMHLKLLIDLVSMILDIPSVASSMKDDVWDSCVQYMEGLVTLLENHPEIEVGLNVTDDEENITSTEKPYRVHASVLGLVEHLDDENTKMLQATDAHSTEYVTKLQNEAIVERLITRVQCYLQRKYGDSNPAALVRIYIRRIEHLYFKIDRKNFSSSSSSTEAEKPEGTRSAEKPEGTEKPEGPEGTGSAEKPEGTESEEKPEATGSAEKPEGTESEEKPEATGSAEKPEGTESEEKPEATGSAEKPEGTESEEKPEATGSAEKPEGTESEEKPEATGSAEKPEGTESEEKPEATGSAEKPEGTESAEKPEGTGSAEVKGQSSEVPEVAEQEEASTVRTEGGEGEGEQGGSEEGKCEGEEDASTVMATLTKFIYNTNDPDLGRIKTRAMLCHIYHHALHDRWFQARDLMMMSHLQESINLADVSTQILYNRSLVQLGMCAFRHGMIKDAHNALVDIQSSGRSKELLAQGLIARHERTPEQEKLERRRQIPFHMHINLELMECVYLTSAMLSEIPYIAAAETEGRRRIVSKSFHHQLKYHEKQSLVGPPESMREHVVAAAHAMRKGNWKMCRDYLLDVNAWDLFVNADHLKEMLTSKIQEETLRTYIFTYGETYDSLSLERLSEMFELPLPAVHCIVSKMIFREEILASLDEPTHTIVMHHAKPNKLQCQALLLSDKIGTLADHNEELMKLKHASPWTASQPYKGGGFQGKQQFSGWQGKHKRPPRA